MVNVMISHEACHYLNNRREGRFGVAALKLDVVKAYDIILER